MSGSDNSYPNRHNAPVEFDFDEDDPPKQVALFQKAQGVINGHDTSWEAFFRYMTALTTPNIPEPSRLKLRFSLTEALKSAGMGDGEATEFTKILSKVGEKQGKGGRLPSVR